MLNRSLSVLFFSGLVCSPILPQAVISTHSGVINLSEGQISIDNQPVAQKPGRFVSLAQGSELTTQNGRAEVLLTPNVILRVGDNSAIRMVSNAFADTRVEICSGSAILRSEESAETPVTILYKDYQVQSREGSTYRFDADPPRVTILKGKAKVSLKNDSLVIGKDQVMDFAGSLQAKKADPRMDDDLDIWAGEREAALAAENEAASKTTDDLSIAEGWQGDSDSGDLSSGASPSFTSPLSPYGISPGLPGNPLYGPQVRPLNPYSYSSIYSYTTVFPTFPYAFGYYAVPVFIRPPRLGVVSRPVTGVAVWHPRPPTSVVTPTRPLISRPVGIGAAHVGVGHR